MNHNVVIAIAVGVAFSIFFTVATNYFVGLGGLMADVWKTISDVRERRIRLRIDQELAKHGLTSDMVVEALNGMDEFRFFMHGTECIARKGPDGKHQFVVLGDGQWESYAATKEEFDGIFRSSDDNPDAADGVGAVAGEALRWK